MHSSPRPKLSELGIDLLRVSRLQLAFAIWLPFVAFSAYWVFAIS